MAKIDIERKKSVWPWIIGLIVLLVIIWGAFELFGDNPEPAATTPAVTQPAAGATAD